MYGPFENADRLQAGRPEEIDTMLECSSVSTHSDGSSSGMPLWGSRRRFKDPSHKEKIEGRNSPVMHDDLSSVSTAARTSTPASPVEKECFGYLEMLGWLPTMQDDSVLVCKGSTPEQMWESEHMYSQTLMQKPEEKNTLALTNYAIILHNYHHDSMRASMILTKAIENDPTCVEALNAYGSLLCDVAEMACRDPSTKGFRDTIYDAGLRWGNRAAGHPNNYDFLTKLQHKVQISLILNLFGLTS